MTFSGSAGAVTDTLTALCSDSGSTQLTLGASPGGNPFSASCALGISSVSAAFSTSASASGAVWLAGFNVTCTGESAVQAVGGVRYGGACAGGAGCPPDPAFACPANTVIVGITGYTAISIYHFAGILSAMQFVCGGLWGARSAPPFPGPPPPRCEGPP